jgi:UDP-N-acetylmuramoyl-tripeptide--D-alanyl-D-alanine ligase
MALAVADLLGVHLPAALHGLTGVDIPGHRSQLRRLPGGLLLVDCYNANPQSTSAALQWLATLPVSGPRIAILGSMGELGPRSALHHEAILKEARVLGLDAVVALGSFAEAAGRIEGEMGSTRLVPVASLDAVPSAVSALAGHGAAILLKGSRSVGLEAVLPALETMLTNDGGEA